jgi:two-component system LytT family response regulator
MEILNAIIVDDEERSRKVLRRLLASFCPEVKIVGEAENIDEAFVVINKATPQLVFLDVQMPTGNGFTLLEKYKEVPFDVVFVTSFDQYAISAIKFSALDYLLKPVDTNELRKAVDRALSKSRLITDRQVQIVNLLNNIDPAVKEKRISVHKNESVVFVNLSDIIHIEADDRYSLVKTFQLETYTLAKTLKEIEDFLCNDNLFIRISRSLIVNITHVKSYTKDDPCMITMSDGMVFEAPRRKKQEILKMLKK